MIERILPRLNHLNPSVVLSSVKVLVRYLDYIDSPEAVKILCEKISSPLVHLLQNESEIQYVALRNIRFLLQKQKHLLKNEIKHFFISFDEPHYLKLEKLEILTSLCTSNTADVILREMFEYGRDPDAEVSRKAIKCIGIIAMSVDVAADQTIKYLMEIVRQSKNIAHILNESAISLQAILRKYPKKYNVDKCVKTMVKNLELFTVEKAKCAAIWMLGEYSEKVKDSIKIF